MYEYDEEAKKAAYKMYEYDPEAKKGYVCFYKGQRTEVYARNMFDAREAAAKIFKVKAKKSYEVSVYLAERPNGEPVIHSTAGV